MDRKGSKMNIREHEDRRPTEKIDVEEMKKTDRASQDQMEMSVFKRLFSQWTVFRKADFGDNDEVAFGKAKGQKLRLLDRPHMDFSLLVCVILLVAFGSVMVISSGESISLWESSSIFLFVKKQIKAVLMGLFAGVACYLFGYKRAYKFATPIMVLALLSCLLVFVPGIGITRNGAARWINVGTEIQPSEILKFAALLFVSANLHKDTHTLCNPKLPNRKMYGVLFPYLILIMIIAGILLLQPHTSATVIIVLCIVALLFAAGMRIKLLLPIAAGAVLAMIPVITLSDYRMKRVLALLDPSAVAESSHQSTQALYAFGSGGLLGKGLGNSIQKFSYLPEPANDFILPIVGEELGFIGVMLVFVLFGFLIIRGFVIAAYSKDSFSGFFAFGITFLIGLQFLFNVAVVTSLIPNTGITLPFISYGGSSMAIMCGMIGFLLSISKDALYDKI